MPLDIDKFFSACARFGLIIDTNLLLLLAIGSKNTADISKCKFLSIYSEVDYKMLVNIVKRSNNIRITPYIISELSNFLIDSKNGNAPYFDNAKQIIEAAEEYYHEKRIIGMLPELKLLGYTDLSVVKASEVDSCAVVTADSLLYKHLMDKKQNVMHFQTFMMTNLARG